MAKGIMTTDGNAAMDMRRISLLAGAFILSGIATARTVCVPTQPVSPFADTEASTNVSIRRMGVGIRDFRLHLRLDEALEGNLEVGFGRDADGNGALDAEEIETVYGLLDGLCLIENVRTWERLEEETVFGLRRGAVDIHLRLDTNSVPIGFTATCGGDVAFASLSSSPPLAWLFRREWDVMRVVRRGAGAQGESVRCESSRESFTVRLR